MSQAATLPTGWAKILDDIRRHIDDAIAATDARLARTPVVDEESPVSSRQQTLIDLGTRLQGITERLRSAEQVIEATDTALAAEESLMQQHQTTCGMLSQRLAEWASGQGAR